uniref:MICOS complex subunit MIC19 n=1 Tax=Steinernema glaseri TaxID=37863 RepID=A0A1I8ACV0_9BILA
MGAEQSQESQPTPAPVRVQATDIPEEYKSVGVSSDVVQRVRAQQNASPTGNIESDKLKHELVAERERSESLRQQLNKLSELQKRNTGSSKVSIEELEERKKIFDDTVERVQKQFFSYQRENACSGNEADLMSCLEKNKNRILNCSSLVGKYEECVNEFRKEVLSQS